jgi:ribonuclease D
VVAAHLTTPILLRTYRRKAQVAELVDALVSGTSAARRGGSSPLLGTILIPVIGGLPDLSHYRVGAVAIDTETMGLDPHRDRLCVVQLSPGDGTADVVQIPAGASEAPNLTKLLADGGILKIFHFARFDLGVLQERLAVMATPVYCTKIASRLARTYTDKHGLKDLVREVLGIEVSKQQQSSDWGADTLTDAQVAYAASDVLHLHALKERLDAMLAREGRADLAAACFRFLPDRVRLDLAGWAAEDIFAHS